VSPEWVSWQPPHDEKAMNFQILSHAGLIVRSRGKTLVVDPWAIGSCYWRSWWNYPPVDPSLIQNLAPDVVYITHSHWDHFHGPTLRKFRPNTLIAIPFERSTRMKRDLKEMGFTNVMEVPHGRTFEIAPDFTMTPYQFASPWGDSALVVEAEAVKLFNANDAKFMGGPLDQILRRHGRFDFAFRSHSSANDRVCYRFTDRPNLEEEDRSVYAESWFNFMKKVGPRYAIPFASNHCYLHKDVVEFNKIVETPIDVKTHVEMRGGLGDTEVVIMVSGDSWDSSTGFDISKNDFFATRNAKIREYARSKEKTLLRTYQMEDRIKVTKPEVVRFFGPFFKSVPRSLRKYFKRKPIVLCAKYGENKEYFVIDIYGRTVTEIPETQLPTNPIIYETTARILKQAMAKNMFGHLGISKRVVYRLRYEDAKYLGRFKQLLSAYEYEALPLSRLFSPRTLRAYVRRWREILLYIRLAKGLRAGRSPHELETQFLR